MAVSVGEIEATLKLIDQMTPALKQAKAAVGQVLDAMGEDFDKTEKSIAESMKRVGQVMTDVGGKLSTSVTLPLAAAGAAVFKFSKDYDTAMTKVETLTNNTAEEVAQMRGEVLKLAGNTARAPQELAEGLLVVSSTGLHGAQAMDVLGMSARASAVGLGETKDIARSVTSAMTAYGSENLSAAKASDILFAAVREGGAEASEFAGTLGRVVGIGAQLGVSFEEVAASVATFTRLGVDADEAVTALRGTMSMILHPSAAAREELKGLGTSIDEVRKSIRERGLATTMIDLIQLTKGNYDSIGTLIPNVRALAGILGTAGAQGDAYKEVLHNIQNSTGDLDKAFARVSETLGFKWNQFLSEGKTIAIEFGDAMSGAFLSALQVGKRFLDDFVIPAAQWFARLPEPVKEVAVAVLAIGAALGPVLYMFGNWISLGGSLLSFFTTAAGLITGTTSAVTLLSGALPLLFAAAIITGLVILADKIRNVGKAADDARGTPIKGLRDSLGNLVLTVDEAKRKTEEMNTPMLETGRVIRVITPEMKAAAEAAKNIGKGGTDAANGLGHAHTGAMSLKNELAAMTKVVNNLTAEQRAQIDAGLKLGKSAEDISKAMKIPETAIDLYKKQITEAKEQTKGLTEEWRDLQKAMASGVPEMKWTIPTSITDELKNGGQFLPEKGVPSMPWTLPESMKGDNIFGKHPTAFKFGDYMKENLGGTIMSAITGGGKIGESIGGLFGKGISDKLMSESGKKIEGFLSGKIGNVLGDKVGGMLGGAIGSIIPGLGTIAGSFLGKGVSKLFGGLFGGGEKKKTNTERDAWVKESYGSADQLREMAKAAGVADETVSRLLSTTKLKDYHAAQAEVVKQIGEWQKKQEALAQQQQNSLKFQQGMAGVLKEITSSGAMADAQTLEMIQTVKDAGKMSGELREFQKAQVSGAIAGLSTYFGVWSASNAKITEGEKQLIQLRQQQAQISDKSSDDYRKVTAQIDALSASLVTSRSTMQALAVTTTQGADAMAGAILASFGSLRDSGVSAKDAVAQISPVVDALAAQMTAAKITGGDAFNQLISLTGLMKDEIAGPAVDAVLGLNQTMIGLHNTGILTQGMFSGLSGQVTRVFDDLVSKGKNGNDTMMLMQPTLQTMWQLVNDFGFEVDDATKKLLGQAEAAGVVGDKFRPVNEQIRDALKELVALMKDFVAQMQSAQGAAQGTASAVNNIPDNIPEPWRNWGDPPSFASSSDPFNVEPMALGGVGMVTKPTLFLAGEAGPEQFAFSGANQTFDDPSAGTVGAAQALTATDERGATTNATHDNVLNEEIRGLRRDMQDLPRAIKVAISDAYAKRRL